VRKRCWVDKEAGETRGKLQISQHSRAALVPGRQAHAKLLAGAALLDAMII